MPTAGTYLDCASPSQARVFAVHKAKWFSTRNADDLSGERSPIEGLSKALITDSLLDNC